MPSSSFHLDKLRKLGWIPEVVERWNHRVRKRIDLFGFADIVAVVPDRNGLTLLQVTTYNGLSARLNKMLEVKTEIIGEVLSRENYVELWGWKIGTGRLDAIRWEFSIEFEHIVANKGMTYQEMLHQLKVSTL